MVSIGLSFRAERGIYEIATSLRSKGASKSDRRLARKLIDKGIDLIIN